MVKKYFRDITISLILALSMALAFFLILNVIDIVNKFEHQKDMEDNIIYKFDKTYIFYNEDINKNEDLFNTIVDLSVEFDGIVQLASGAAVYGQANDVAHDEVILSIKEEMYLETSENEIISINSANGIDGVYISESIKEYVENVNGKDQILINNTFYKVLGCLANHAIENDNRMVMFWENISDKAKNHWIRADRHIQGEGLYIRFISNKANATENMEKVLDEFDKNGFTYEIFDISIYEVDSFVDDANIKMVVNITYVLLVFAFISCLYVSDLWINKRKKELIIRKAFGCSVLDIMKLLLFDLIKISVVSAFIAILLQYVYRTFVVKESFLLLVSWKSVAMIMGALILIVAVSLIIPIIKVVLIKPAKGVK